MPERPEEYFVRLQKVETLRREGIEPYAYRFEVTHRSREVKERFSALEGQEVRVAGRVMAKRDFGKSIFSHIRDEEGNLQIYLRADVVGKDRVKFYKRFVDLGDILGVQGEVFRTKTGEVTVLVRDFQLLTKGLLPLPEKWHGLRDPELRYRERYVDLIASPESRGLFKQRTRIIRMIRRFLDDRGFWEVETPVLQPIYGGATARPFVTHSHALDMRLYLRISNELYLKRLLVGGFERVYEFSRDFRNEGIDRLHYPEFTLLEAYAAYWDYHDMMTLTEELLSDLSQELFGTHEITYQGQRLSFRPPFQRIRFTEALSEALGYDVLEAPEEALRESARKAELEGWNRHPREKLIDKLFDRLVGDHLVQPTFVLDHPVEISPLAKRHREDPRLVERFELFVAGMELANAFSELNDPVDQRKRFEAQIRLREKGDEEIPPEIDEDFLKALEYGMPPAGGIGIGIDRLVMILTDSRSVRDVILFPQLRPRES